MKNSTAKVYCQFKTSEKQEQVQDILVTLSLPLLSLLSFFSEDGYIQDYTMRDKKKLEKNLQLCKQSELV